MSAGGALGQPGLAGGKGALQGQSGGLESVEEFMTLLNLARSWQKGTWQKGK